MKQFQVILFSDGHLCVKIIKKAWEEAKEEFWELKHA